MDRLHPSRIATWLTSKLTDLRQQRFFQDRLSLGLIIPALVLNVVTLVIMLFRVHPTNFLVPVHYSSLGGFDALGSWYQPYRIAAFGFIVTVINVLLAIFSFNRSRIASFFLLAGTFVVALFCLIIGTAFAVVV